MTVTKLVNFSLLIGAFRILELTGRCLELSVLLEQHLLLFNSKQVFQ